MAALVKCFSFVLSHPFQKAQSCGLSCSIRYLFQPQSLLSFSNVLNKPNTFSLRFSFFQVVVGKDKSRELPSVPAPLSVVRGFPRPGPVRQEAAQPSERKGQRALLLQENQACHSQQEIQCVQTRGGGHHAYRADKPRP